MSIEVRQLIIKSNVLQPRGSAQESDNDSTENTEEKTNNILEECRLLIQEELRELKER